MKKKKFAGYLFIAVLLSGVVNAFGEGLNDLAEKTSASITGFFSDKYDIKTSIIGFENTSGLSDLEAQQFYQLVVAKLDPAAGTDLAAAPVKMQYMDLMVNFNRGKGEFNLNRSHLLNYLVYLKLMRNKNYIGVGISIFSRVSDRLVYVKYVESLLVREEMEFFDAVQNSFRETGFSKIVELDARRDLLDLKTFLDATGRLRFLFLYPDKIDMYHMDGTRLNKYYSLPLNWSESYFPVMEPEGRLAVIPGDDCIYVTVGCNFSGVAKILTLKKEEWAESGSVNFVPFRSIRLNDQQFIVGGRYAVGKNYFVERLRLVPLEDFQSGRVSEEKATYTYLEKMTAPFYACDFSVGPEPGNLETVHIIDRDYKYRLLADNFEPLTLEIAGERGAALAVLDGEWLAVSNFSIGNDRLYFYKIKKGSRQLMYQNDIEGEIFFITEGMWQAARGFWVCVKIMNTTPSSASPTAPEYKLQFWSKKSE